MCWLFLTWSYQHISKWNKSTSLINWNLMTSHKHSWRIDHWNSELVRNLNWRIWVCMCVWDVFSRRVLAPIDIESPTSSNKKHWTQRSWTVFVRWSDPRLSDVSEGEVSEAISEASAVSEKKPLRRTPQVQEFLRHAQINRESVAALGFFWFFRLEIRWLYVFIFFMLACTRWIVGEISKGCCEPTRLASASVWVDCRRLNK